MAIEQFKSLQLADAYRGNPTDDHGKLRWQFFDVAAATVVGDADTEVDLVLLPPGNVRVIPYLCRVACSAFGAARTLDVGHRAFSSRPPDNADVAEDPVALATNLDVAAAGTLALSTAIKYDLYSRRGVTIYGRLQGGTYPIGATLRGAICYVYE